MKTNSILTYSNSNNICKWGFELVGLNQAILFLTDCLQGAREGDPFKRIFAYLYKHSLLGLLS